MTLEKMTTYSGKVVAWPHIRLADSLDPVHLKRSDRVRPKIFFSYATGTNKVSLPDWSGTDSNSLSASDDPKWKSYLQSRLSDLSAKIGQPGYPSREALIRAWNVAIGSIPLESPTPSVVPGDDDSVELVWQRCGWVVEMEIGRSGAWMWAKDRATGEKISGDIAELPDMFRDVLLTISD